MTQVNQNVEYSSSSLSNPLMSVSKGKLIRVLYDISVLGMAHKQVLARTGVFRLVENLAQGLVESPECQLSFCSTRGKENRAQCRDYLHANPQFNRVNLESTRFSMTDIFHSPFHSLPDEVNQVTRLLTVHDLIPILYPKYVIQHETKQLKQSLSKVKGNDWLTCVSQSTKDDICNYIGIDASKIFVTHLAADSRIFYVCKEKHRLAEVRKKYGIGEEPYFLSLSTLEPRKNITQVINCFAQLVQQQRLKNLKLVLVGAKGWQYESIFKAIENNRNLEQQIVITDYVIDEDLAALYSDAIAFLYLSFYEGFGLPPLEAMQCGTPVITSDTSSLPEVVGDGGLMHSPRDSESICQSMFKLYQNSSFRHQLALKSHQQAQKFRWDKCVQQTINVYQTISSTADESKNQFFFEPQQLTRKKTPKTRPRIAVDGVFFQLHNSGIARLWQSVLKEWSQTEFSQEILVLDRGGTAPIIPGICNRVIPQYSYEFVGQDSEMLERICHQEGIDLFISSYYTTPVSTPSIFMAYDLVPEVMNADCTEPRWREKHHGVHHASAYISISENTAQDLIKFFPKITRDKIKVAHCGVESIFTPANDKEIQQFKVKYNLNYPYFLIVGERFGFNGYKNVMYFLEAFNRMPDNSNLAIVFTGGKEKLEAELLQLVEGVETNVLQLSDAELRAAYSGAIALVYPSRYEGFGLPILEAMACACPVITCRNSSIPEVAAEAALYVGESDIDELVQALHQVQNLEVRSSLIVSGLAQAKKFSWAKMAAKIADTLMITAHEIENGNYQKPSSMWKELRQLQLQLESRHEAELRTWKKKHKTKDNQLKKLSLQLQKTEVKLEENSATAIEIQQLSTQLKQAKKELKQAQIRIKAMESSKFWKIRQLWFTLKQKLGMLAKE